MSENNPLPAGRVLYIPHGGGPLPLLNDAAHQELVNYLQVVPTQIDRPSAIVVVSAHWEAPVPTVTGGANPELIYDYYGFPPESYQISYPAPGDPELAGRIVACLQDAEIPVRKDEARGFDHGVFVPLKLMYPAADIPCVQLSLCHGLDPAIHVAMGRALRALLNDGVLILGSGLSFHNMRALVSGGSTDERNEAFENWLADTCASPTLTTVAREQRLINWAQAPHARYCHPREEHLLPLHVCFGAAGEALPQLVSVPVLGKRTSAFLW